jgi:hypothetical protein
MSCEALRAISDTNTAIYSIGFSTGKSEAVHYAYKELPIQPGWVFANQYPIAPQHSGDRRPPYGRRVFQAY